MSWEDLEGQGEASHHRGEVYRQVVEEYLESGEFLRQGEPYSGTKDIRLTRPAHNEGKVFRVETKNSKARIGEPSFVTEVARHCLDYHFGDEEFEWYIFAPEYSDSDRWRHVFDGRIRREDEIKQYFDEITEKHNLTDDETEKFSDLDVEDFREFIEIVALKKATSGRLQELIRENTKTDRAEKKWEFYIQENEPKYDQTEYLPNFFKISAYPESVWEMQSLATGLNDVFDAIPRYFPLWIEGTEAYSLVSPENLPDELDQLLKVDDSVEHNFEAWAFEDGTPTDRRVVTGLLNKQLIWRGTQLHEHCLAVRHDRAFKLIFALPEAGHVQETLTGEIIDPENAQTEKAEGYTITRDMGRGIGHRYGHPEVKFYGQNGYTFISTGWLFTAEGAGNSVIEGDAADDLHNSLDKNNYGKTPNRRAQFRQWRQYLRMGGGEDEKLIGRELAKLDPAQRMTFERPQELHLEVRPPKNSDERDKLMEVN